MVVRLRAVDEFAPLRSGETQNGGFYQSIASTPGDQQVILGAHFARLPLAFHLTYYRYLDDNRPGLARGELDWMNFSFERRF